MTTAASVTPPVPDNSQRSLENFVVNNADLEQLELKLLRFNLFEALKLVWHEVRHSDFLAYLLDPGRNHGLGDRFLKAFLQCALRGSANQTVTPNGVDVWNLTSAEVRREWQNIDIFIRDDSVRLAVIIENKVESEEHSNQLARYYQCVAQDCKGWNILAIFLTTEGESPSDKRFIALGYDQVSGAIERLLGLNSRALDSGVRTVMEHYVEMLRRYIVTESEVSELCRRIYSKHKQALDLIFEHRPDRQQFVREHLEEWVKQKSELLEPDHSTKSAVRFIPKELDWEQLRKGPRQGPGTWTPTGRMLLFELSNAPHEVILKLYIGPGPAEIRQKLFDLANAKKPLLRPAYPTLYPQYCQIFARKLLTAKSYELPEGDFIKKLQEQWTHFLEKDLPPIVAAIEEGWVEAGSESPGLPSGLESMPNKGG
jgi:hypothetical protein